MLLYLITTIGSTWHCFRRGRSFILGKLLYVKYLLIQELTFSVEFSEPVTKMTTMKRRGKRTQLWKVYNMLHHHCFTCFSFDLLATQIWSWFWHFVLQETSQMAMVLCKLVVSSRFQLYSSFYRCQEMTKSLGQRATSLQVTWTPSQYHGLVRHTSRGLEFNSLWITCRSRVCFMFILVLQYAGIETQQTSQRLVRFLDHVLGTCTTPSVIWWLENPCWTLYFIFFRVLRDAGVKPQEASQFERSRD